LSQLAFIVSSEYGHITSAIAPIQRLSTLLTPKESVREVTQLKEMSFNSYFSYS